jgi:hypothetical protein
MAIRSGGSNVHSVAETGSNLQDRNLTRSVGLIILYGTTQQ